MGKITELTAEQAAMLTAMQDEYLRYGLNCDPADRPRANSAFERIYQRLSLGAPWVIWVSSPLGAHLARAMLAAAGSRAQVGAQVRAQVRAQVWDQVGDQKIDFMPAALFGQHDAGWVAWVVAAVAIGVKLRSDTADTFRIFLDLCQSCMWAYAFRGAVIACDRPAAIHRDKIGRLHNTSGPAMAFRDGWTIHAVHGVRVPGWIIEQPSRITVATIESEQNSEIKRVMIERFGWDRYAQESGAEVVDHDERWGTLYRRVAGTEPILWLGVINRSPEPDGSFRRYVLPVHPELRPLPDPAVPSEDFGAPQTLTAFNAVASTFGMTGAAYAAQLSAES